MMKFKKQILIIQKDFKNNNFKNKNQDHCTYYY
jgi:hypothetical protein